MRIRTAAFAAALITATALAAVLSPPAEPATGAATRLAADEQPATIGALFTATSYGALGQHFCTASVVDSPAGDLVLTAAHCMTGQSGIVEFVPGYRNGRIPYGVWTVTRVVVDRRWSMKNDPDDDFAFLIVSRPDHVRVEDLTGGESVGIGEGAGSRVNVTGYPTAGNDVVSCQNTALAYSASQLAFICDGFSEGTSGSPLLANVANRPGTVVGVIGGYEQGGDLASVSYAARFGTRMAALYQMALAESSAPAGSGSAR